MKGEEGKAAAQKYVQRRTAKNKMATKVLQKCMAFSCFYDKLHFQKSSNFLKNCNFKMYAFPLYYASSGGKVAVIQQASKVRPRTKSPSHKMRVHHEESNEQGWMCCQAYVTGERYNIHGIRNYLSKMEKYKIAFIPEEEPNVLRVCIKDENGNNNGEVFFFRWLGSLVLWNVPKSEV